jgi:hypothetical protein
VKEEEDIANIDIITEEGHHHPHNLRVAKTDAKKSHIIIAVDIIISIIGRTDIVIHHQVRRSRAQAYHRQKRGKSRVLSETVIN